MDGWMGRRSVGDGWDCCMQMGCARERGLAGTVHARGGVTRPGGALRMDGRLWRTGSTVVELPPTHRGRPPATQARRHPMQYHTLSSRQHGCGRAARARLLAAPCLPPVRSRTASEAGRWALPARCSSTPVLASSQGSNVRVQDACRPWWLHPASSVTTSIHLAERKRKRKMQTATPSHTRSHACAPIHACTVQYCKVL